MKRAIDIHDIDKRLASAKSARAPLGQIQKKGFDDHEPIPEDCLIDGAGWEYVSTLSRKPRRTPPSLPPWTQIGNFARKPTFK